VSPRKRADLGKALGARLAARIAAAVLCILAGSSAASAQAVMAPGMDMGHAGMPMSGTTMSGSTDLAVPMEREGSGTSWQPDSAPEYGAMHMTSTSMLMTHYAAFPRYVETGSARGSRRFDAPNWFMVMGSRDAGRVALRRAAARLDGGGLRRFHHRDVRRRLGCRYHRAAEIRSARRYFTSALTTT
jgi:hypothetical protein